MRYSAEAVQALEALPTHPVFQCDLNAGVIAIALRFDARDSADRHTSRETQKTYGFPCAQSANAIRRTLVAAARKLGALVDFGPIIAVLSRPCDGYQGDDRGLHDGLEALADLALHSGHVIVGQSPHDDAAIEQLLSAMHLALFETLPLTVAGKMRDCILCADGYRNGQSLLGQRIAGANISGALRPGFVYPGTFARAGGILDGRLSVFLTPEVAALRLAIAAMPFIADIDASTRAHLERFHPEMVQDALRLGILKAREAIDICAGGSK
jgi:hypothetical protein